MGKQTMHNSTSSAFVNFNSSLTCMYTAHDAIETTANHDYWSECLSFCAPRDIEPVQTMEWATEDSVTISKYNKSASSVIVTGKEDQKLVPIKRVEIVTGTETTSPPNPRRDESSVDSDNYVGVLDIEPVQTTECTAEETVTITEYNKPTSSVFVTGKEDIKRVAIKIVTGTETTSTPNPRRDESSVDRDNYVAWQETLYLTNK